MNLRVSELQELIDHHYQKFNEISTHAFNAKPLPHKWSKKEILGHLIDSAQNNIQRFIRGQYEDTPSLVYNQDEWVSLNDYQNTDLHQLIELWRLLNLRIVEIWRKMPEENLKRKCEVKGEIVDIEWHVNDYVDHLKHHIDQIIDGTK